MTIAEWREVATWINLKWDRQPLDPIVAEAWFERNSELRRFDLQDALAAIDLLVRGQAPRPQFPELLAALRAVVAGKSSPPALPEPRETIPDNVVVLVDTILARNARNAPPQGTAVEFQPRPKKPKQLERSEPLDPLQRLWARTLKPSLECAGCHQTLVIGDGYEVRQHDLFHAPQCPSKTPV
jgi:hypothetical protein